MMCYDPYVMARLVGIEREQREGRETQAKPNKRQTREQELHNLMTDTAYASR